eukprot:136471-Rhodomonas_salina.1
MPVREPDCASETQTQNWMGPGAGPWPGDEPQRSGSGWTQSLRLPPPATPGPQANQAPGRQACPDDPSLSAVP